MNHFLFITLWTKKFWIFQLDCATANFLYAYFSLNPLSMRLYFFLLLSLSLSIYHSLSHAHTQYTYTYKLNCFHVNFLRLKEEKTRADIKSFSFFRSSSSELRAAFVPPHFIHRRRSFRRVMVCIKILCFSSYISRLKIVFLSITMENDL